MFQVVMPAYMLFFYILYSLISFHRKRKIIFFLYKRDGFCALTGGVYAASGMVAPVGAGILGIKLRLHINARVFYIRRNSQICRKFPELGDMVSQIGRNSQICRKILVILVIRGAMKKTGQLHSWPGPTKTSIKIHKRISLKTSFSFEKCYRSVTDG